MQLYLCHAFGRSVSLLSRKQVTCCNIMKLWSNILHLSRKQVSCCNIMKLWSNILHLSRKQVTCCNIMKLWSNILHLCFHRLTMVTNEGDDSVVGQSRLVKGGQYTAQFCVSVTYSGWVALPKLQLVGRNKKARIRTYDHYVPIYLHLATISNHQICLCLSRFLTDSFTVLAVPFIALYNTQSLSLVARLLRGSGFAIDG